MKSKTTRQQADLAKSIRTDRDWEERRIEPTVEPVDKVIRKYKQYHTRSRPGVKEKALIKKRLLEGYTVQDLCDAIDGCHASGWHQGQNENGRKYQSLSLIFRDSDHVLSFLELWHAKPVPVVSLRTARNLRAAEVGNKDGVERSGLLDDGWVEHSTDRLHHGRLPGY